MDKWQEREDNSLDPIGLGGRKRERREGKKESFRERERESTFSLDFSGNRSFESRRDKRQS